MGQKKHKATSKEARHRDKATVYESLAVLNRRIDDVLFEIEQLRKAGIILSRSQRNMFKISEATINETRAWINSEVTESLRDREERDHVLFGAARQRLEAKYRDPADALLEPKRI